MAEPTGPHPPEVIGWANMPWRVGQSVGRTIYACPVGSTHRNGEVLIGMMDTRELAEAVVRTHNAELEALGDEPAGGA